MHDIKLNKGKRFRKYISIELGMNKYIILLLAVNNIY